MIDHDTYQAAHRCLTDLYRENEKLNGENVRLHRENVKMRQKLADTTAAADLMMIELAEIKIINDLKERLRGRPIDNSTRRELDDAMGLLNSTFRKAYEDRLLPRIVVYRYTIENDGRICIIKDEEYRDE